MSTITCIHGLEATACKRCKPVRPKPVRRKPIPKPAAKPKPMLLFDTEAQARLEQAMLAARQAAHAGTLLSKQLGKKPKPLSPIEVATNG
nr:MAG TPA: hypothetical protein [Caudoviricetes sp.]